MSRVDIISRLKNIDISDIGTSLLPIFTEQNYKARS